MCLTLSNHNNGSGDANTKFADFMCVEYCADLFLLICRMQTHCKSCSGNRVVQGSKSVKLDIIPGKGFFLIGVSCTLFFVTFYVLFYSMPLSLDSLLGVFQIYHSSFS